jgi:hypothetical protein
MASSKARRSDDLLKVRLFPRTPGKVVPVPKEEAGEKKRLF